MVAGQVVQSDLPLLELALSGIQAGLVERLDGVGDIGLDVDGRVHDAIGAYSKHARELQPVGEQQAQSFLGSIAEGSRWRGLRWCREHSHWQGLSVSCLQQTRPGGGCLFLREERAFGGSDMGEEEGIQISAERQDKCKRPNSTIHLKPENGAGEKSDLESSLEDRHLGRPSSLFSKVLLLLFSFFLSGIKQNELAGQKKKKDRTPRIRYYGMDAQAEGRRHQGSFGLGATRQAIRTGKAAKGLVTQKKTRERREQAALVRRTRTARY